MANTKDRIRNTSAISAPPSFQRLMDEMTGEASPPAAEAEPQTVYVEVVPEGAIVPVDGGLVLNEQFYPAMGATFDGLAQADWVSVGERLFQVDSALQWIIGDWINYGVDKFKVSVEEIANHFNRDPQTLQNWMLVCKSLPQPRRRDGLDFGHHAVVATLSENAQIEWLRRAHEGDGNGKRWSVKQLRLAIKEAREATKEKRRKTTRSLASAQHKTVFERVFDAAIAGKTPKVKDIEFLREWLTELGAKG